MSYRERINNLQNIVYSWYRNIFLVRLRNVVDEVIVGSFPRLAKTKDQMLVAANDKSRGYHMMEMKMMKKKDADD